VLGPQLIEVASQPGTSPIECGAATAGWGSRWSWKSVTLCRRVHNTARAGLSQVRHDRFLRTFCRIRENHAESVSADRCWRAASATGSQASFGAFPAWRSGTDPTLVNHCLKRFSMLPSVAKANLPSSWSAARRISDYQGFIEGALRCRRPQVLRSGVWHQQGHLRVRIGVWSGRDGADDGAEKWDGLRPSLHDLAAGGLTVGTPLWRPKPSRASPDFVKTFFLFADV